MFIRFMVRNVSEILGGVTIMRAAEKRVEKVKMRKLGFVVLCLI